MLVIIGDCQNLTSSAVDNVASDTFRRILLELVNRNLKIGSPQSSFGFRKIGIYIVL